MRIRFAVVVAVGLLGCKPSPMAKIEAVRDALLEDDPSRVRAALPELPACAEPKSPDAPAACLLDAAVALGSKTGFHATPPDQASAAAVAGVFARDGHGEWLSPASAWLGSLETGDGPGPDALRLAVARRMADAAPRVGRAYEEENDARAFMKEVTGAVPGACSTYMILGGGAEPQTLAPELTADHSPCVQKDLERRDGPGGKYGHGTWRGAEGALALWKNAARALRAGAAKTNGKTKAALEARLAVIEAATSKITMKKLPPGPDMSQFMTDVHGDAGAAIAPVDAGAAKKPR
jgi:hypothetical protein